MYHLLHTYSYVATAVGVGWPTMHLKHHFASRLVTTFLLNSRCEK